MTRVLFLLLMLPLLLHAQEGYRVGGTVRDAEGPLPLVNIYLKGTQFGAASDGNGNFMISGVPPGNYTLSASYTGYRTFQQAISVQGEDLALSIRLEEADGLDEVVVTGTMKAVSRLESPVPVEVYSASFFRQNPTPNVFEALQTVNGVRPQINCSVCNTGDIHINGLEGPYTLVLIDGMPIVSGLASVYGLSGIPASLIEQVEIVKGPASSLYGSEAVGGLINVITKHPDNAPVLFADSYLTDWEELNVDFGFKTGVGQAARLLFGANYYNYSNPIDNNGDNFTDVTLQNRISLFQKWDFSRPSQKPFSLAGRFFYEDRWGGEMQWTPEYRGGSEVYGESIYTTRYELIGRYQLPVDESLLFQFSYSDHDQNSVYGDTEYLARQRIGFGQLTWDLTTPANDWLFGITGRYNHYDDNTPVTEQADQVFIPSAFAQNEFKLGLKHKLLLGARFDYDRRHGTIFTPRLAYKYQATAGDILRLNAGTGFRVVNLFTEEHAALTGSREVVVEEDLQPERSYNVNLNYLRKFYMRSGLLFGLEASAWYTHFTNAILPDYDSNPNQVIYRNLRGTSESRGISVNADLLFGNFKALLGATLQEVSQKDEGERLLRPFTETWSGTWSLGYKNYRYRFALDYTGNIYGPMRLPLLGPLDPRRPESPVWSIQNIQFTYTGVTGFEFYTGIKNLLNWTPNRGNPFIIARAEDPFDRNVVFDADGNAVPTPDNPYALTFDPTYVYAPNQGRRLFFGIRYKVD